MLEKKQHTDSTIHGLGPRLCVWALEAIRSYSLPMPAGALAGPGRANGALMSSLSAGDSLGMVGLWCFFSSVAVFLVVVMVEMVVRI